ncbi:MAG TPA: curli production assembly protein CsgB, partial [Pseudomonas sp.]|nr:curli production assembly protein CsgB [Pseudomonas sp.]
AYNDARIEQTGQGLRSAVTQYGVGQQINIVQGR